MTTDSFNACRSAGEPNLIWAQRYAGRENTRYPCFSAAALQGQRRRRIGREVRQPQYRRMEPGQLSEHAFHELSPMLGRADEIAIVSGVSGQKRNLLSGLVGGQGRDSGQRISLIAQQQKRFQRRTIGAIHGRRPLPGVENFRAIHLAHQAIPLLAESLVWRNLVQDAQAQSSPAAPSLEKT